MTNIYEISPEYRRCENCRWHEGFTGVCCNNDSEYAANYTANDQQCNEWHVMKKFDNEV